MRSTSHTATLRVNWNRLEEGSILLRESLFHRLTHHLMWSDRVQHVSFIVEGGCGGCSSNWTLLLSMLTFFSCSSDWLSILWWANIKEPQEVERMEEPDGRKTAPQVYLCGLPPSISGSSDNLWEAPATGCSGPDPGGGAVSQTSRK